MLELGAMIGRYDRASFVETLPYLADRELIGLSAARYPFDPIPKAEWRARLRGAFAGGKSDPAEMAGTSVELSSSGEQVLRLFGIGYP